MGYEYDKQQQDTVSNEAIMGMLLTIKGDIGEIKGTVASQAAAFIAHVADDRAMGDWLAVTL